MQRSTVTRAIIISSFAVLSFAGAALANASNWQLLLSITFEEVESDGQWEVRKTFPDALVQAADGFTIKGYYVPIEAQPYVTQFLLVPDPADCPFCGSSGYGISLEVLMSSPLPDMAEATELTVSGTLELIDDTETYQFARLRNAVLIGN